MLKKDRHFEGDWTSTEGILRKGKRGSSEIRSIGMSACSYPPKMMEYEATIKWDGVTRRGKVEGGTEAVEDRLQGTHTKAV